MPEGSRTHAMSSVLQGCRGVRRAVLAERAHRARYQPIRPPVDIGVVVATGDSSLIRGTPCRQAVRLADTWQTGNCGQPGAYPGLTPVVSCLNQPTSMFFSNSKEGPIRIPETVPLDRPHYGKWRHVCPQGTLGAVIVATLTKLQSQR